MPYFNDQDLIVGQFSSHHQMHEIYVHIIAAVILFITSSICILYLYNSFRKSGVEWPGIIHGIFYTGLIGLGEFAEHFFPWDPFLNTSLHYLHHIAAPAAMVFFYLGINEFYDKCSHPREEVHTISNEVAMGVFAGILTIVIILGGLAGTPWDERLEGPFLGLVILPLLAITAVFINTTRKIKKSMLAFYFPAIGVSLSALSIVIWLGRFGDVNRIAAIYITAHSLQNILHAATAAVIALFVLAVREGLEEDILYQCEVTEKSKLNKKNEKRRDFNLEEQ
jgi:hypothetical protein